MTFRNLIVIAVSTTVLLACQHTKAEGELVEIDSLDQLYSAASGSEQRVRMKPGVYRLADYLTDAQMEKIKADYPKAEGRPPRWLLRFSGSGNTFDFTDVTFEIDTTLFRHIRSGYGRSIFVDGNKNTFRGLTIRNTGPEDQGGATTVSIFGNGNLLEGINVYVRGSRPYGYGDLLGKGGPNITGLQKSSGIMVAGQKNTLRRCKVFSRAFGHCFYIQKQGSDTKDILLEDCYAEGVTRTTNDMLAETSGVAHDLNFRSVYQNRDGRFMITPGYTKSLVEDGFRTYGGVGNVTLRNCTAINTRAGFEIGGTNDAQTRTILEGCQALGTERAYLIGSNVQVRNSRGNIVHGPLLYLRENTVNADVELELTDGVPTTTVHVLATIAGEHHRVTIRPQDPNDRIPALPIMLGFGMPAHAEMSSPILPAKTTGVRLTNHVSRIPIITSDEATDIEVQSPGPVVTDSTSKEIGNARGAWPTKGDVAR
jgi:hypothetical protein